MKWINIDTCPLCGSEIRTLLKQILHPYIMTTGWLVDAPIAIVATYYTCSGCGLVYESPRPDDISVKAMYSTQQYRSITGIATETMDSDECDRSRRIAELIVDGVSHLDVGCSRGYMLQITQDKGYCVLGVEPNPEYPLEGIETVRSLDDVAGKWDVITCIHALEHVADFKGMADKMIDLLADNGTLILEVPGEGSRGGPLGMVHLYWFQQPVIERIFERLTLVKTDKTPHDLYVFRKDV